MGPPYAQTRGAGLVGGVFRVVTFRADIAGFREVDAEEIARFWRRAEFGADAHADIKSVFINNGRGDKVVRRRPIGAALGTNEQAIEFPDELAGFRLEAVKDAVAARENDLRLSGHHGQCGIGPLPFDDVLAR